MKTRNETPNPDVKSFTDATRAQTATASFTTVTVVGHGGPAHGIGDGENYEADAMTITSQIARVYMMF